MNSSRFAVGLVGLAVVGLWYGAGGAQKLPATRAAEAPQRVAAPLTHENLAVYFVHGPDQVADAKVMSLQEALEREMAVVHETSNVNVLAIENRSSEYELFVQSNDIVKGGKQDRVVQTDMLLPPKSGVVALPVHCVEQGRWTGRGAENALQFASSYKCAAGKELKYANASGQQAAVWDNVRLNQTKLNDNLKANVNAAESPTSFQLTLESSALEARVAAYEAALKAAGEERDNIIGVVFVVNGQIAGAEVYGSNALFRKAWPKLLNAAAVEAVADRTDAPVASAPSAREVERYLAYGGAAESATGTSGSESPNPSGQVMASNFTALGDNRAWTSARVTVNEEVLQTEGRAQTGEALQTAGRAVILPAAPFVTRPAVNPTNPAPDNVIMSGSGAGRVAAQPPPPVNDANRLNSSRTENRSTLVVESRDVGRQGAVIHRSYTPAAPPAAARPAPPAPARPTPPPPMPARP
jgi:hypothetical protein